MEERTGVDLAILFRGRSGPLRGERGCSKHLALAALTSANGACYIQNGGILTPPAYGTLGNATRGLFHGPNFQDVDIALEKMWHVKERYSAQLRIEVYNVFNHVNFAQFSDGASDPSGGGGTVASSNAFGFATTGQQLSMNIAQPAMPVRLEADVLTTNRWPGSNRPSVGVHDLDSVVSVVGTAIADLVRVGRLPIAPAARFLLYRPC